MNEYEQNIEIMKELRGRIDAVLATQEVSNTSNIPDPTAHKYISLVKSGFRIIASIALFIAGMMSDSTLIQGAGGMLFFAEILGIAEELV